MCEYLDKIEVKDWQEKLNNKDKKDISLYSIIKENLNEELSWKIKKNYLYKKLMVKDFNIAGAVDQKMIWDFI